MRGIKESREIRLKAFFTSRATSIWVGFESRSADTAWWAISVPLRQQIPTWTGQGDPSVCVRGLEGHDPCVGGWKRVANLTVEPAAAHFETTRPNTEPTAMGRILRSAGESPSLRRAISLPPKNHGRQAGGMPPLKAKRTRPMMERAPRPATKESHASSESWASGGRHLPASRVAAQEMCS